VIANKTEYELVKSKRHKRLHIERRLFPLNRYLLTKEQRKLADSIRKNGYIILCNAVEHSLCDALADYYEKVASGAKLEYPPKCEYFDENKEYFYGKEIGDQDPSKLIGLKMLDLYSHNKAARDAMLSPAIVDTLNLIFNARALAFQQLGMIYGTEPPLHQDTAYVRVSKPFLIAASWIALEDVQQGSGELELIPGSHWFKKLTFDSSSDSWCNKVEVDPSSSVWWNYQDKDSHDNFLEKLQALKKNKETFKLLAKKGDCLIWISHLVHGGSAVEHQRFSHPPTRKSLVTHYCPDPIAHPMYFHAMNNSGVIEHGDSRAAFSYRYF